MTDKSILIAVARADLIICSALRVVAAVAMLSLILLLVVRARWPDPYLIDYDAPGVDVTSEGPEGYTSEYYKWE